MIFGYSLGELRMNEVKLFQNFFEQYNWQNPFAGTTSSIWPWSLSSAQLDYILLPQDMVIKNIQLLKQTFGSDHKPQVLEVLFN